jgi:hypothetical protein
VSAATSCARIASLSSLQARARSHSILSASRPASAAGTLSAVTRARRRPRRHLQEAGQRNATERAAARARTKGSARTASTALGRVTSIANTARPSAGPDLEARRRSCR